MIIDSISNKNKILTEFLKLCVFEGISDETLKKAVKEAGLKEEYSNLIFDNGCLDLIEFFIRNADKEMIKHIEKLDLDNMKVREKIKESVKIRLKLNDKNKAALKKIIHFYSHPKRAAYGLKNCYKTADLIWYEIGDKSTDYNFYSKRIILSKVYIRTLHYFVNDNSKDNQKTWQFLDKQIENIMKFSAFKAKAKDCLKKAKKCGENLSNIKQNINSPKDFINKLPFFRLFNK